MNLWPAHGITCPICGDARESGIAEHFCSFSLDEDTPPLADEDTTPSASPQDSPTHSFGEADQVDLWDLEISTGDVEAIAYLITELSSVGDEEALELAAELLVADAYELSEAIAGSLLIDPKIVTDKAHDLSSSEAAFTLQGEEGERRGSDLRAALILELERHGSPLHFTRLAAIVNSRYPLIQATEEEVSRALSTSPAVAKSWQGVYAPKRRSAPHSDSARHALEKRYA